MIATVVVFLSDTEEQHHLLQGKKKGLEKGRGGGGGDGKGNLEFHLWKMLNMKGLKPPYSLGPFFFFFFNKA